MARIQNRRTDKRSEPSLLGSSVYNRIRSGILRGEYDVHQRISDIAIAKQQRVSRTPVREALFRLEQEGLLSRDGRRKLVVTSITADEVGDIYPIIAVLEALAGRLAATNLTNADLDKLRVLSQKMEHAAETGADEVFFRLNGMLHDVFIRRAGNGQLEREIGKFRLLMRKFRVFLLKIPGRMKTSLEEHKLIVDAFAARDPDRVEAAIRTHVSSAQRALLQALEAVRVLS